MNKTLDIEIVYSECFEAILQERFKDDWTAHLICSEGSGELVYNGKIITVTHDDVLIVSHTELITDVRAGEGMKVKMVVAPMSFLTNQLPANNYSIGGCIRLYDHPILPLLEGDYEKLEATFLQIHNRLSDRTSHPFYMELIGSLLRVMMYDLFAIQDRLDYSTNSSERTAYVVKSLMRLLEGGECRKHREVSYYAEILNVSPKYLSDTVKRLTGNSVSFLIDRYTIPIIIEFLKDDRLSLNQICDEMNFSSISYFSRYCSKHLGMTPSAYRNKETDK